MMKVTGRAVASDDMSSLLMPEIYHAHYRPTMPVLLDVARHRR
jgi:hypothetical protein